VVNSKFLSASLALTRTSYPDHYHPTKSKLVVDKSNVSCFSKTLIFWFLSERLVVVKVSHTIFEACQASISMN
jgi:hypothetical protein